MTRANPGVARLGVLVLGPVGPWQVLHRAPGDARVVHDGAIR